ncbi:MAG: hypothetical protein TREMPRED_002429 [Tremellales sp. Tagirdzhanova-0007]|nr:MAG: hypothetical protein TREMPRED_002429 [Tremellales sp. Tagirdzhanova-0007]
MSSHTRDSTLSSAETHHPIQASGADAPAPPSAVADYEYPNVPDTTEPQQGKSTPHHHYFLALSLSLSPALTTSSSPLMPATGPGGGGVVEDAEEKSPLKKQVNGYAKKIAGKVFGHEGERESNTSSEHTAGA